MGELVLWINRQSDQRAIGYEYAIGERLLEEFYPDYRLVFKTKHRRPEALRVLYASDSLRINCERLGEMVRVAALRRSWRENDEEIQNLTYSHMKHLIKLPDPELQFRLAQEANREKYSVRQLELLVRRHKEGLSETVARIEGLIVKQQPLFEDRAAIYFLRNSENLLRISPEGREKLARHARNMAEKAKGWLGTYRGLAKKLGTASRKKQ